MKITPDLLVAATGCTADAALRFAEPLSAACERFSINTPRRVAMFIAQIAHESGSLRWVRELWGPTDAQKRYEPPGDLAKRLGNLIPGDGKRYMGRGLMQITGRFNYGKTRDRLREWYGIAVPDFEETPEALETPLWACASAAEYWHSHRCNEFADANDFRAVTKAINGGLNGYTDRLHRLGEAEEAIAAASDEEHVAPALMPGADGGSEMPTSPPAPPPDTPKEPAMPIPAIVTALLPTIIESIPKLGKVFGSGSQVADRNIKAAEIVVETVKAATGAVNEQEAVERMRSDPTALRAAQQAVDARWFDIAEAGGGGIDGARRADAAYQAPESRGFLHSPVFWVTVLLLPLVYVALYAVLFREGFSNDIKAMVIGAVFGGLLTGGIQSFFYGTSASSQRKTDMLNR